MKTTTKRGRKPKAVAVVEPTPQLRPPHWTVPMGEYIAIKHGTMKTIYVPVGTIMVADQDSIVIKF